jgi:transcriptional regulator with XRE-family HTH domain
MIIHTPRDLGKLVRARRLETGLNATKAADLAFVSRRLLIELETGKRKQAGLANVLRILEILGLSVDVSPRSQLAARPIGTREPDV